MVRDPHAALVAPNRFGFGARQRIDGNGYFVIPSISAISPALNVQPIAFTFCSTCSTRVAPAMTLATCGREASHEKASSSRLWPRACANACSCSTMSSLRGVA